jgi:hypothetical protein
MAVMVMLGVWPASPARADAARPGNTVSVVESVTPDVSGVRVDIVGGDAFVRLRADRGVEVQIPGYLGEPYLWIRPDGTVWRNAESPATVLNEDRYLNGDEPDVVTRPGEALPEPRWQPYGRTGTVLWHDHRVHWMGSGMPPTIDADGLVQRWEVPISVDGVEVIVGGALRRREGASSLWWGVAVGVAAALAAASRRLTAVLWISMGASAAMAAVAWRVWASLPSPARAMPTLAVLATLASLALAFSAGRRSSVLAGPLTAGAGMALLLAGWLGGVGVTAAVVPGLATPWLWRVAVTITVGVGAVALFRGVQTASRSRAPVSLDG